MDNFDLLFTRVNDIGLIQQELKKENADIRDAQRVISQQVQANGQAVAALTLRQMEEEVHSDQSDLSSTTSDGSPSFDNLFANDKSVSKPGTSKHHSKTHTAPPGNQALPHHALPKMHFPKFDGTSPKIWFDNCINYFTIYGIPKHLKVTAAVMHLEGNAAKWWQAYKQNHAVPTWKDFCVLVQDKFGADDFRTALTELLNLKQTGTVEDYTIAFQSLQFDITMHNCHYDELFFATKYVEGLKDDIRAAVEPQVPVTVDRAAVIAKIQQRTLERGKHKYIRNQPPRVHVQPRADNPPQPTPFHMQRIRQLRDYRRANNLCFACGDKYEPGHNDVCPKKQKPHVHAMVVNDLDKDKEEITEEMLNHLAVEDALVDNFCQLSLNTITTQDSVNSIKLKAQVQDKVMLILVDSGSSHSFVNSSFVQLANLQTIAVTPRKVKLANGHWLVTDRMIPNMKWYIQGHTLCNDMLVLDIGPYDAILGFDWLKQNSPMTCDWTQKLLTFSHLGQTIQLQGVHQPPFGVEPISAHKLYNATKGNDTWAFALVTHSSIDSISPESTEAPLPSAIQTILDQFAQVFQDPKTLPPERSYDHSIPLLPGAIPFNTKPYHYSPQMKTEIEEQVTQLLQSGLITHSSSPFASPVLLVKKKDGTWRFCVDYRKLNDLTIKNRFPLPIIEEILDELHGATFFTKLDMKSGYHQIRMLPADEYKTAFKTHHGHYEFKVMPFGLTNAPATFQCVMNQILQPFLRKFVLVFLDDILIYSSTLHDHVQHLTAVLQTLQDNQLYLKYSKCSFAQSQLEYLGHIISSQGVATAPNKTAAMLHWPTPTNFTDLRAFLGLTGYYRRFVRGYGIIAKPLTNLLRQKAFQWTMAAQEAFDQLKLAMTTTPVLALPNFSATFTVETDACGEGVGAVLMQAGQPIAFLSKALGEKHRALSIYEKEFLALIMAVEKWKHYLQRQEFIILTDHKSLAYLNEQNLHSEMQRKAMTRLMGMQFKIVYRKGKDNVVADALSRLPHLFALQAVSLLKPDWIQEVTNSYLTNPRAQELLQQLAIKSPDSIGYSLDNGIIRYKNKIWIAQNSALQTKLLHTFHSSALGGHSGITATYHRLKNHFTWKGMKKAVEDFIKQCTICQQAKHSNTSPAGLLQPLPIPKGVWMDISMDFIDGLPKAQGYSVIMVIVDRLTKFAHFVPVKHPYTAQSIAQLFMDHVVKMHGLPHSIVSDRDTVFVSQFWKSLFKIYKVQLAMSTSYHPQTDGQTERVNQCLEMYLRCAVQDAPKTWPQWLSLAQLWYNSSYHSSLGCSPFKALYGVEANIGVPSATPDNTPQSVTDLVEHRELHLQNLKEHLAKAQNRMKTVADRKRSELQFAVGDQVLLKLQPYTQSSVVNRPYPKLAYKYFGPFKVLARVGAVAYRLELPPDSKIHSVFHVSQLKPFHADYSPVFATLPSTTDLEAAAALPEQVLDRRLVKKGNTAILQVFIKWSGLPDTSATWEDYNVLRTRFPNAPAWGQAGTSAGGTVRPSTTKA